MLERIKRRFVISGLLTLMALALLVVIGQLASADASAGPALAATPVMPPTPNGANNQVCLGCHSNPSQ